MKKILVLSFMSSLIFLLSCVYGIGPFVLVPETYRLGTVWYEREGCYNGVWTRRGDSNVFDAVWTCGDSRVTAILTIQIRGNRVYVQRRYGSEGGDLDYRGNLSSDGTRVSGTYTAGYWEATITGNR